ncbi:DUF2064 domain-containing protein [Rickettsiales bacterium]|nr:DUF2064 domain-containing protein [Rickettsiales bacterium]
MKTALAIFAKTPGLSLVKTRLAADIGVELAEEFYLYSVAATEEICQNLSNESSYIKPYWALAEKDSGNHKLWENFSTIWTGEGGFGTRLYNIYSSLLKTHDAVIMIGTDSPQINPAIIYKTIEKLSRKPDSCVFGPAKDGGFYLFGAKRDLDKNIWESVEYSQNTTLKDLKKKLKQEKIKVILLPENIDVDDAYDLNLLYSKLKRNKNLLPKQRSLLNWLEKIV